MTLPQFIDIEYCETDSHSYPTAVAWSLADGRIKAVVLSPDDDWLPQLAEDPSVDLRWLYETGVPVLEVIREMEHDLADRTVYSDGLDPDEALVDTLYQTINQDTPFEVAPISELLSDESAADLEEERRRILYENQLDATQAENGVYALLLLARDKGLIDEE